MRTNFGSIAAKVHRHPTYDTYLAEQVLLAIVTLSKMWMK